jgi:hypothetical protein
VTDLAIAHHAAGHAVAIVLAWRDVDWLPKRPFRTFQTCCSYQTLKCKNALVSAAGTANAKPSSLKSLRGTICGLENQ